MGLTDVVRLRTDSSAAKSFVYRLGIGHLEIRDLWLQRPVAEGKVEVVKVKVEDKPRGFNDENIYSDSGRSSIGWNL